MRRLHDIAVDCGGRLVGADREFVAVNTDTRKLATGELFVALRGPNFDGNAYLAEAAARGAAGAIAEREGPPGFPVILVADALSALQRAAQSWRERLTLPVVAVAGSNGKTTSKEMIAAILAVRGSTLATAGNLNNHIGVPLTLLRLTPEHRHAVIEMGANHAGDVTQLAAFAAPSIGIVTNAGAEHLEGFGSLEGAARAEGELFAALGRDGTAILNADDSFAPLWRDMTVARIVTFGLGAKADFTARDIHTEATTRGFLTRFTLVAPSGETTIELQLAGKHNVLNALGAAAAASAAGATLGEISSGLARMRPVAGRLQLRAAREGAWLIDDSYNANPASMRAALAVLGRVAPGPRGRRIAVLGDMRELGTHSESEHRALGERVARDHIDLLVAVGPEAASSAARAGELGVAVVAVPDAPAALDAVRAAVGPGDVVLVKGSRAVGLDAVASALVEPPNEEAAP